ncbi:ribosomal protein S30 [Lycorma delicatula]|uniref:ribosomal protein S30 n=1 Tax=Lycorma delicatula TaxID=130591 RepID=UPI003F50FAFA
MHLEVRGQSAHTIECDGCETIADIKQRVSVLENIPCDLLSLYNCGKPLTEDLQVCSLANFSIDVTVPLLGGKVHGSLARAGKVKGQTPKVEKVEKKKKKTGRAKRRIQYNRRFVNVVQTFGRKRGPNANS